MNGKMTLIAKKALMAATLAATAAGGLMATSAEARPGYWHGGYHGYRGGGGAGAVIAGGLLGVAVGAAIADHDRPYYGRPYGGYYAPAPVYYGPAYGGYYGPPPPYYNGYVWRDGWYWDHWGHRYGGWGPHGFYRWHR